MFQRDLTHFTKEWVDCGVSILSYGWKYVRKKHLINVLGVCASGVVLITCHDSSINPTSKKIVYLLFKSSKYVGQYNVVQVITHNATNSKAT